MDPSSCIKTLSSSGLTTNGPVVINTASSTSSRSLALPPGETQINDIGLTPSGYGLFSAAADKVGQPGLSKWTGNCLFLEDWEADWSAQLSEATVPGSNLKLQFLNFYLGEVVSSAIQAFFLYVLLLYKVLIRQYVNLFALWCIFLMAAAKSFCFVRQIKMQDI